MNSRGPSKNVHINRNFTITVASCISVIMPGDFKVVRIKQVFRFNSVRINGVPLYSGCFVVQSFVLPLLKVRQIKAQYPTVTPKHCFNMYSV